jgi:glycosyltransferase involved in cell wall biosynthesis
MEVLKSRGLEQTVMVIQGIDTTAFHPAPRAGWLAHRFVVFSGGKLEYRKGQDLVVAAFARFHQRHPDALLMVAWHNHWPKTMAEIVTAGHVHDVPSIAATGRPEIVPWLGKYGIPADAVLDLGLVPNAQMAPLVREADVALFPNRAEGGTNLVAMELLACGVPCILSENTGHLDLTSDEHNIVLHQQTPCRGTPTFGGTEGWGESSVDEIVEALEFAYACREDVQRRAANAAAVMARASWRDQIDRLFDTIGDVLV